MLRVEPDPPDDSDCDGVLFGISLNLRYWLLLVLVFSVWGQVCAKTVVHQNTVFRICEQFFTFIYKLINFSRFF